MDRNRFIKRARELHECSQLVKGLTRMPDRATEKDFHQAADLMTGAANDIDELIKAKPTGCVCRRIQDDNYDYLDYAEACLHHRQLYVLREKLKENYAKMEKALKNEVRMKLITAALSGAASMAPQDEHLVENALTIADDVIHRITESM